MYKHGGHVTMIYRDQQFRMHFDNKGVIQIPSNHTVVLEVLMDSCKAAVNFD